MSRAPRRDTEEGFALAEVLVGFAILALVCLAMLRAFGGSVETLQAVAEGEARMDLAERLLATSRATPHLAPGRREGVADGLRWWTAVEAIEDAPALPRPPGVPRLMRLRIGVGPSVPEGAPPPAALLTTLVFVAPPDA
ncbi:MAG: hypothetical protein ABW179_08160 [Methylobacterium sp.]